MMASKLAKLKLKKYHRAHAHFVFNIELSPDFRRLGLFSPRAKVFCLFFLA
jgi:hypothetical protein